MGKLKKESVMQRQEMNGARVTRFCSILALTIPAVLVWRYRRRQQRRRR